MKKEMGNMSERKSFMILKRKNKKRKMGGRCLSLLMAVMLCALSLLLTGCGKAEQSQREGLVIYASVYPVYDFTVKLAGEYAQVSLLVPAGMEPHDFELGTQDVVKLEEADILVYCGAGMEHWVDKTLETLSNTRLTAVEASEGITLLSAEGMDDPHVWLDPENAILMMENIKNALCQLDSANAEGYEANFEAYKEKLQALNQRYEEALGNISKHDIVVSHASFGYLCNAYGLNQVAIEGVMADSEPDPATMSSIINFMNEQGIQVIFDEALENQKVVETIAKETGADVQVLDPIEGLSQTRMEAGEDYFSIMEKNLEVLKAALQ